MDLNDKIKEKAVDKAASYINIKPRTAAQVRSYLKGKGYEDEAIDAAIELLKEYRYIDDFEFASLYFRYGFDKGRGISRIKRELLEKGVASDTVDAAFDEMEDIPDQKEMALDIARSMLNGIVFDELEYDAKRRLQAKIGRRLVSRGFSSEIVYKVINEVTHE